MRDDTGNRAPLLLGAKETATLLSISRTSFHRLRTQGLVPMPVRLGRRCLWRVEELQQWVKEGCPPVDRWEAMKSEVL